MRSNINKGDWVRNQFNKSHCSTIVPDLRYTINGKKQKITALPSSCFGPFLLLVISISHTLTVCLERPAIKYESISLPDLLLILLYMRVETV